jgi:hypothetical protein
MIGTESIHANYNTHITVLYQPCLLRVAARLVFKIPMFYHEVPKPHEGSI